MAVIDLSAGWVASMMPRLFRSAGSPITAGSAIPAVHGLLCQGNGYSGGGSGAIALMKGTPPVSTTSQSIINDRAADILCRFMAGSNNAGDFVTSQVNVNPAIISTQYAAATASGTATWFWWYVAQVPSGAVSNTAVLNHQIIGTVGGIGSGADLEMASTSIILGEQYRIANLRLQFPTTWTY